MPRDFVPLDLSGMSPRQAPAAREESAHDIGLQQSGPLSSLRSPYSILPSAADGVAQPTGATWWRSLDELAQTPEFEAYLHREFPENADAWLHGSRRDFLKLMAASFALAGLTGCDIRQPREAIVPTVKLQGHQEPGTSEYFTTAMEVSGVALGLVVKSQSGRPIKVEGNRQHPSSRGATNVFAQAATLDLYDPDRLTTVLHRGAIVPHAELLQELAGVRQRWDENQGTGLRLLLRQTTSPTVRRLLDDVTQRWPLSRWQVYDPVCTDTVADGMKLAFGDDAANLHPVYHFDKASVVLSIDCDFLAARERPLNEFADFMSVRRVVGRDPDDKDTAKVDEPSMVKLYHLESSPTLTGAKADRRLIAKPEELERVLTAIASQLNAIDSADGEKQAATSDTQSSWIAAVVGDLQTAAGKQSAVVAVGIAQPAPVQALAHAINEKLGAVGSVVEYVPSPLLRPADASLSGTTGLATLVNEMTAGDVQTLIVLDGNPALDAPADVDFGQAVRNVSQTIAFAPAENETTRLCRWLVPQSHFLESWGDVRTGDGIASIVQPLIDPLYDSLSMVDFLAALLGLETNGYDTVRQTWQQLGDEAGGDDFDTTWHAALRTGVIEVATPPATNITLAAGLSGRLDELQKPTQTANGWTVLFRPDPTIWDGRFVNNGWLQELPKPLSKLTWDNTAWISPADAKREGLANGDVVRLSAGDRDVDVPVWVMPGQAAGCLTLFFGYGQQVAGRVGEKTGTNLFPLRTSEGLWSRDGVQLTKTGATQVLACTQHHQLMEGRHLVRAGSLAQLQENPERPEFVHPPEADVEANFYEPWPYEGHKWGMTIDLTACTGCTACVIACQSENNIPVVGKDEVARNREMHWIRVDTWFEGGGDEPEQTLHQPVPCMHCEQAPCEVVCPVAATNHSEEGLNQMVYNRCIGTRYCSNNCPYKVRRFNFLEFSKDFITSDSLQLLSNPEVTVREQGVMEKCTYCVQRIESARIDAHRNDREIQDGDVVTACQSVCPAQAIRFGDLNDADSRVRETADHPLSYGLLANLNTRPRTTYLAEVKNR